MVDVAAFSVYGDAIRGAFRGMGPDPNSLANLDQDLPNYLHAAGRVPLASLPDDWLYVRLSGDLAQWSWFCYDLQEDGTSSPTLQKSAATVLVRPRSSRHRRYCEAWCHPRAKANAKSIDMCQNPRTKEYKLDMAKRIADPLWTKLDAYFDGVLSDDSARTPFLKALHGVTVEAPAADVTSSGDEL